MLASSRQARERAGVRAGHAACAAEPRREGRATALRAGRPFGIWCCCAWVLCFKELSKNPSIWAPSLLPAWRGAEQMVCKQNSVRLRKRTETCPEWRVAGAQPRAPRAHSSCGSIFPRDVQAYVCGLLRAFELPQTASRLHCEGFGRKYRPGLLAGHCSALLPRLPVPVRAQKRCSAWASASSGL